jgi:NitT/TauT family transport system permease protein
MFKPFAIISKRAFLLMVLAQVSFVLLIWQLRPDALIPGPLRVLEAAGQLLTTRLFYDNLLASLLLTIKAMGYSILLTLLIGYLSVLPFFRALAHFIVKCRYLTLTGLIFIFTLLTKDGGALKLSLLIFGIVPFFVTSFLSVITAIPNQEFELCQTLGYNRWEMLYEVIVVGKADQVVEIVRQNFAFAWMMITMVEGLNMSEGGIGTLLIKYNKYNDLSHVLALQGVIFGLGLFFDYGLGRLRRWLFAYVKI